MVEGIRIEQPMQYVLSHGEEKNYLFAGSHVAAQRAAMIYSFFAKCKKEDINSLEWLKYVFDNIMEINHKKIQTLYPAKYKKMLLQKNT